MEIGPLGSVRNLMQGDIITDVACRAACAGVSMFKIELVCCRKVEYKEALDLPGWDAKLVQEVVFPMQDG